MDNGGTKPDDKNLPDGENFDLEVNEADLEIVSADIESPGDNPDEAPADDAELVEGDLPEPEEDPGEDKPAEEEKPEEEKPEEETPAEEEKPEEEAPAEEPSEGPSDEELDSELEELESEEKAEESGEDTTVAEEDEPVEEEKPEEEKPAEEEKPEEEAPAEEPTEEEKTDEEKPEEEEKTDEIPPIVVEGQNAPVDSTSANSTFPVEPAKETKDNRSKIGLFVMIAVIVLLLLGCGIFVLISGGKNKNGNGGNGNGGNGNGEVIPSKVDGLSEFDINLLQDLSNGENSVYSPMSIKYAMSVLAEGADGDTKNEITDVIGDYKPTKYTNNEHLSISNAIFVRDDFKNFIRTTYTDAIKEKYGANAIYDPFNSAATINDWVYKNTFSLIPRILDDSDLDEAVFVIANTVAIDMEWDYVIQCPSGSTKCLGSYSPSYAHEDYSAYVRTYEDDWRSKVNLNGKEVLAMEFGATINNYDIVKELGEDKIRNTVKAAYDKCVENKKYEYECELGTDTLEEYLNNYVKEIGKNFGDSAQSTTFQVHADDDVKMFAKDFKKYGDTQLQYVAIMPTSSTLEEFIEDTDVDEISTLIGNLKDINNDNFNDGVITKITGLVPEFDFSTNYALIPEFQKLGVNKVFTSGANLSKMIEDNANGVHISKIAHSAKIKFTNFGVKAAAATALVGAGAAMGTFDYLFEVPVEIIDLTFDKPFLYLIRDKATGEVWFMGTVYEGKAEEK